MTTNDQKPPTEAEKAFNKWFAKFNPPVNPIGFEWFNALQDAFNAGYEKGYDDGYLNGESGSRWGY